MLSQSKEEKEYNNNIRNTKLLTPRPYQIEAVDKVCEYFNSDSNGNSRAQIILPCASGKTIISLWIVEKLKSKLTLYLVPSLQLLKQVKDTYRSNSSMVFNYIFVCSAKDIDDEDEFNVYANLYEEIDRSVTTDPDEIYRFIVGNSNNNSNNGNKIIFSTYQSLDKIVEAVKYNNNNNIVFDLSISDEAHRTAGLFKSNFNLIHDDRNIKVAKRLYMTATPRVISNSVKDRLDDDKYIYDMSDGNIFGNVVYRKTFKDAIGDKILSDYKILAVGISDDDIHNYIKDNKQINLNSEYTTEDIANNFALNLVMDRYNLKHSITFHSTIKKAKDFSRRNKVLFDNHNIMNSYHINGNMSSTEKQQIIDNFKKENTISTISNARCLSEGVDIPAVDLVYFCDTKNSKIDIIQAIGRALRITKDKTKGYIVVPIYHNNLNNLEEEINISSFERLINIIRAMSEEDSRLEEEIKNIVHKNNMYYNNTEITKRKDNNILDIVNTKELIDTDKIDNILSLINFDNKKLKNSLFFQLIDKVTPSWDKIYVKLKEFIEVNGRLPIYNKKKIKDNIVERSLNGWLVSQKRNFKNNRLTKEQIDLLLSIEKVEEYFETDYKLGFEERVNELKDFAHANNRLPKINSQDEYEKSLNRWLTYQKINFKRNKLTKEEIDLLLSIKEVKEFIEYSGY